MAWDDRRLGGKGWWLCPLHVHLCAPGARGSQHEPNPPFSLKHLEEKQPLAMLMAGADFALRLHDPALSSSPLPSVGKSYCFCALQFPYEHLLKSYSMSCHGSGDSQGSLSSWHLSACNSVHHAHQEGSPGKIRPFPGSAGQLPTLQGPQALFIFAQEIN